MTHRHTDERDPVLVDAHRRQRNTVWPDTLVNSRGVDWFLWHGSPTASLAQKAGAAIFGLAYTGSALAVYIFALRRRSFALLIAAVFLALVGWKVLANALPYGMKNWIVPLGAVVIGFICIMTFLAWPILSH